MVAAPIAASTGLPQAAAGLAAVGAVGTLTGKGGKHQKRIVTDSQKKHQILKNNHKNVGQRLDNK